MRFFVAKFLIGDGRQVATVGHVLSGTEAVRVKLASGEWRPARVAGEDQRCTITVKAPTAPAQ